MDLLAELLKRCTIGTAVGQWVFAVGLVLGLEVGQSLALKIPTLMVAPESFHICKLLNQEDTNWTATVPCTLRNSVLLCGTSSEL